MENYIVTDMIMENTVIEKIRASRDGRKKGYSEEKYGDFSVCRFVANENTEMCRKGTYITVYTPKIYLLEPAEQRKLSSVVSFEISRLFRQHLSGGIKTDTSVLIVGIGNREITSDAVGPLTSDKVEVTRHIQKMNSRVFERMGMCSISAIACGVMGETGMDTAEIIKGIAEKTKPDILVAVDALAAKECKTLGSAIQISDSGIAPGAGIGNRQIEINSDTMGIPVIALGIPTVVSAATLIGDTLTRKNILSDELLEDVLSETKKFFVAPKECDMLCISASDVLSSAINDALTVI